jgi:hypothetical protein
MTAANGAAAIQGGTHEVHADDLRRRGQETKEQLGGYYLLDCKDLDEAIAWAKQLPVRAGSVEVRPVMDYEAAGSALHTSEAEARR